MDRFGIGVLNADNEYVVGRDLLSPPKPVWLIQGYNCFSCLWVDSKHVKYDMKSLDQPGSAFALVHWNTWYEGQARTAVRVIPTCARWMVLSCRDDRIAALCDSKQTVVMDGIVERRKASQK
eukprot:7633346-Ditylum_brightwellii.AAC.1